MATVEAEQPLEQKALVELRDQRRPALGREQAVLELVLLDCLGERVTKHGAPAVGDALQALAQLGLIPGERLQLSPDLGVARSEILLDEGHGGAPLLDEG